MMYQSAVFESDFLKYFNEKYSMNESNFQKAIFFIISKEIEKYMSKGIERISNIDTFFNLYGIYHFHLGKETNNKFVERSQNLLFIYFTNSEAYFICVKEHPVKEEWGTVEPIRVLYKEYPQLFSGRVINCEDMQPKITKDEEYFLLFKKGLNCPVKVEDSIIVYVFFLEKLRIIVFISMTLKC